MPPTYKTVNEQTLISAKAALQDGLEYVKEALIIHDTSLGRTTLKNLRMADMMENDIANIESAIEGLSHHLTNQ
jgi:hypothetical protein